MEVSGGIHTFAALLLGKQTHVVLDTTLRDPATSTDALEKRNLLRLPGNEPRLLSCPAHSLVTVLTTLSRLPIARTFRTKVSPRMRRMHKKSRSHLKILGA
jgi:hypothetical protein